MRKPGYEMRVALLRAINVGGRGAIAMRDLAALMTGEGFASVKTVLQSGNVVFRGDERPASVVAAALEAALTKRLALNVTVFVRGASQWLEIVAENPYPAEARDDPSHLVVMVLDRAPEPGTVDALRSKIKGREHLHVTDERVYVVYPDGIGDSKLTNAAIERELGTRGTARNWNTVLKLAALLRG